MTEKRRPPSPRRPASPVAASRKSAGKSTAKSAPATTTRIVARPPAARRPSQGTGEGGGPAQGGWSKVAIATSSGIRKGPRPATGKQGDAPRSPLLDTLQHSKAAVGNVTMRVQERLREQSQAKRRVMLISWAKRATGVVAGIAVLWLVLLSPLFALDPKEVNASGFGTVVDPAMVEAAVDIRAGTSLALLNTAHLADSIREVPGVRAVRIEREWPSGLAITIESREPVAAVPDPDGGYVLVDDEAVQVGRSDSAPAALPAIEVPLGENHVRVLKSVLGVVDALPADLRGRVDNIKAMTEDSVAFTLRDGPRIEWGSSEKSALKAKVLEVLLNSGQADDAAVIDVSAPTLPITSDGKRS